MNREDILGCFLSVVAFATLIWGLCGLVPRVNKNMQIAANVAYTVGVACKSGGIAYEHNPYRLRCQVECWNKGWNETECE